MHKLWKNDVKQIVDPLAPVTQEQIKLMLTMLQDMLDGYPFDNDDELEYLIETLETTLREKYDPPTVNNLAYRIKCWDGFTYRARFLRDNRQVVWNPIDQTYKEYAKQAADEDLVHYQASQEYPAQDIIHFWVMLQLDLNT